MTLGRIARPITLLVGMGLVLVTGCGDIERYSPNLTYPVRTDFLVLSAPKAQAVGFNPPGQIPLDYLATLPRRFSATDKGRVIDYAKVDREAKAGRLKLDDNERALLEEFKSNNIIDPRNLTAGERNKIGEMLLKLFGTPEKPIVKLKGGDSDPLGIAQEVSERLKLDADTLREGSKLYRRHCLHCHGLEGNGRGPTGYWVNPHPRDYHQGIFKFTSSTKDIGVRMTRREDLLHVLQNGIEGTSMPSFGMYPREDLEKLASYVIHLSMRGQVEYNVIKTWFQDSKLVEPPTREEIEAVRASMLADSKPSDEIQKTVEELSALKAKTPDEEQSALKDMEGKFVENMDGFAQFWFDAQSQEAAIVPDPYPYDNTEEALLASAARGAALFTVGTASCVSCHKNYGRESPYTFDAWGTIVRPRDLVSGYDRGGRRPLDMYFRIWGGINGAGMQAFAGELRPNDDDKAKKQDKMWDVVNFMQALHYPDLRAKLKAQYGVQLD